MSKKRTALADARARVAGQVRALAARSPVVALADRPCLVCGRTVTNRRSVHRGIGARCWRRMRATRRLAPGAGGLPFDVESRDVAVLRDRHGVIWHNLLPWMMTRAARDDPARLDWTTPAGARELARAILESQNYLVGGPVGHELIERFIHEFISEIPTEGGVIRGADVRGWSMDRLRSRPAP